MARGKREHVKRLLLGSHGVSALPQLLGGPAAGLRVAFVPTPAWPDAEQAPWVQADRRQLEMLGCQVSTLELATADREEVSGVLHAVDVVFVTGGNAYLVLWHAQRTGFATRIFHEEKNPRCCIRIRSRRVLLRAAP